MAVPDNYLIDEIAERVPDNVPNVSARPDVLRLQLRPDRFVTVRAGDAWATLALEDTNGVLYATCSVRGDEFAIIAAASATIFGWADIAEAGVL